MTGLTTGAIRRLIKGRYDGTFSELAQTFRPDLQLLDLKWMANGDRQKLTLSDGEIAMPGVLTHDATIPENVNKLVAGSVLSLTSYMVSEGKPRRDGGVNLICVIMSFDPVSGPVERIGNPVDLRTCAIGADGTITAASGSRPAAPSAGSYGVPPAAPAAYPAQSAYGQPGSAYGQPQGVQGDAAAYGRPTQAYATYGGPGAQQHAQAYGAPVGQHTYGQPPAPAYGAPPQQGTFGAPPQHQGAPPSAVYGPPGGAGGNAAAGAGHPLPASLAPRYEGRGATAINANASSITQISQLGPYTGRWTIQGRCTTKSDLREYNRNGKRGHVFNFDLLDDSGEIRCVAFGEIAQQFHPRVTEGRVYQLSRGSTKAMDAGKRKWNQTGHDCEVYVERDTVLEEIPDDAAATQSGAPLPRVILRPVKVRDLEAVNPGEIIDVIAVVESAEEATSITRKDGTEAAKRPLVLRDDSGSSVELTLWGLKAESPGRDIFERVRSGQRPVIAIKSAKVGDFNGKSLSSLNSSAIHVDAYDVPGVSELRAWSDSGAAVGPVHALSKAVPKGDRRVTILTIRQEGLGTGERAFVRWTGFLESVKSSPLVYPACMNDIGGRACQKGMKREDDGTGMYHCERCQVSSLPNWRYRLSLNLVDFEDQLEGVTLFGELGESLMGMPASEAKQMEMESDTSPEFQQFAASKLNQRLLTFRIKCEDNTYEGTTSKRYSVQSIEDINFVTECKNLAEMIEDMSHGRPLAAMQPRAPRPQASGALAPTSAGMHASQYPGTHPGAAFGASAGGGMYGSVAAQGGYMVQQQPAHVGGPMAAQVGGYQQGGYQQGAGYQQGGVTGYQQSSNATTFLDAPAFGR